MKVASLLFHYWYIPVSDCYFYLWVDKYCWYRIGTSFAPDPTRSLTLVTITLNKLKLFCFYLIKSFENFPCLQKIGEHCFNNFIIESSFRFGIVSFHVVQLIFEAKQNWQLKVFFSTHSFRFFFVESFSEQFVFTFI